MFLKGNGFLSNGIVIIKFGSQSSVDYEFCNDVYCQ